MIRGSYIRSCRHAFHPPLEGGSKNRRAERRDFSGRGEPQAPVAYPSPKFATLRFANFDPPSRGGWKVSAKTSMHKTAAILGSALFFLIAPFTIGFVVPWWIAGWHMHPPFSGEALCCDWAEFHCPLGPRAAGRIRSGVCADGLGTPAPIAPSKTSRGDGLTTVPCAIPMYLGVLVIILGNALILERTMDCRTTPRAGCARFHSLRAWATKSRLCAGNSVTEYRRVLQKRAPLHSAAHALDASQERIASRSPSRSGAGPRVAGSS